LYDITRFDLGGMVRCGAALRGLGTGAASAEEVAARVARFFYTSLADGAGGRACALARVYETQAYGALPPDLQRFAGGVLGRRPADETPCLTLLATTGDEPAWCARATSGGHQAIPLPSADVVARLPMIHRLLEQFGLDVGAVVAPEESLLVDLEARTFNVFHVAEAEGSPFIPAQDFVRAHGIRSVLGLGGMLPGGAIFAVILFAKVPVPLETAELFQTLALGVKLALQPFGADRVFAARAEAA
jgi:hypothetical protein